MHTADIALWLNNPVLSASNNDSYSVVVPSGAIAIIAFLRVLFSEICFLVNGLFSFSFLLHHLRFSTRLSSLIVLIWSISGRDKGLSKKASATSL
nr:MAG TPA: hypothetical protein [Caudoviricetes sp.]